MKQLAAILLLATACATTTGAKRDRDVSTVGRAFHNTVTLETWDGRVFCSGVIADHVVVTAWHCTDVPVDIYVRTVDGKWAASIERVDVTNDLAILLPTDGRQLPKGVRVAKRAPTWADDIWVIGHPMGTYEYSVTKGIVSHPLRDEGIFGGLWMQHDAGAIGGNSGGPVLNQRGQLVGITSFGILDGLYCALTCDGLYQDTHLSGAVHLTPIQEILAGE